MRVRERQEERQRVREGEQSMDAAWTDWVVYSSVIRTRVLQEWMAREDTFLQVTTHIHTKAFTFMSVILALTTELWSSCRAGKYSELSVYGILSTNVLIYVLSLLSISKYSSASFGYVYSFFSDFGV